MTITLVDEAIAAGAGRLKACAIVGLSARSLKRWAMHPQDRRRGPTSAPSNKLTVEERAEVLRVVNSELYRDLSPNQIVPLLADDGVYIASERTMYRVLEQEGLLRHRGRSRPRSSAKPKAHVAVAPNTVWSWDITYLKTTIRGSFFFLYLVVDVFSRKIVGAEVYEDERADLSADLIETACAHERIDPGELALHADNGGPMKGSTMLATLHRLGVSASFSRPNVSDDNPYSEALFRTLKYHRTYPRKPFASIQDARTWVLGFVAWYNREHLHSGIRFVSPADRHARRDTTILRRRHAVYTAARRRTPRRWSRSTRDWSAVGPVYLNPVVTRERDGSSQTGS